MGARVLELSPGATRAADRQIWYTTAHYCTPLYTLIHYLVSFFGADALARKYVGLFATLLAAQGDACRLREVLGAVQGSKKKSAVMAWMADCLLASIADAAHTEQATNIRTEDPI